MDEFTLIRRYFAGLTSAQEGVALGIGDDCALLAMAEGQQLAVTTDTLVAGRHFFADAAPLDVGYKALAVNLSDLAAMGAAPRWFTLALTLPAADERWLAGFAQGLGALAQEHGIALVGGDTTRGPLAITITAMGTVPAGAALLRKGAQPGDAVCVTGTLGDAALALQLLKNVRVRNHEEPLQRQKGEDFQGYLMERLHRPTARIAAGLALRKLAHAAIDLSDGLAGDLNHILTASGVGATVEAESLPTSAAFQQLLAGLAAPVSRLALQAQGGDDYELCCCLPPARFEEAQASLQALGVALTRIGTITAEAGLRFNDANGQIIPLEARGYVHF